MMGTAPAALHFERMPCGAAWLPKAEHIAQGDEGRIGEGVAVSGGGHAAVFQLRASARAIGSSRAKNTASSVK